MSICGNSVIHTSFVHVVFPTQLDWKRFHKWWAKLIQKSQIGSIVFKHKSNESYCSCSNVIHFDIYQYLPKLKNIHCGITIVRSLRMYIKYLVLLCVSRPCPPFHENIMMHIWILIIMTVNLGHCQLKCFNYLQPLIKVELLTPKCAITPMGLKFPGPERWKGYNVDWPYTVNAVIFAGTISREPIGITLYCLLPTEVKNQWISIMDLSICTLCGILHCGIHCVEKRTLCKFGNQ